MTRALGCVALAVVACRPAASAPPGNAPGPEAAATADVRAPGHEETRGPPPEPPPPREPHVPDVPSGTVRVPVPGFEAALAAFPEGGEPPLPIVLAVHGAGDSPEWQCRIYRELLGNHGVVLCPAGKRLSRDGEGRFFPEHFTLEKIVLATLEAFVKAHPEVVDPDRVAYTAYSQGATMGALMLPAHGQPFRRLALVEGGYGEWTAKAARRYRETGGERVLFGCGTPGCLRGAERSRAALEGAGVEARVVSAPRGGHTYGGAVAEQVAPALPWLLDGL